MLVRRDVHAKQPALTGKRIKRQYTDPGRKREEEGELFQCVAYTLYIRVHVCMYVWANDCIDILMLLYICTLLCKWVRV